MYAHWESEIYAYLSARRIILPFNTMQDLLTNTDMKVMTILESAFSNRFEFSKDADRLKIWNERIKPNIKTFVKYRGNSNNGLKDLILDDDSYTVMNTNEKWISAEEYKDCRILRVPGYYDPTLAGFALQKDSTYQFVFNHFLQKTKENGHIDRVWKQYVNGRQICPDYSGKPLGMSTCFTAFIVLICGSTVSIILLLIEGAAAQFYKNKNSYMNA